MESTINSRKTRNRIYKETGINDIKIECKFMSNCRILAASMGMSLTEFDNKLGLCAGVSSKMVREDKHQNIPLAVALKAEKILGLKIDEILSRDFDYRKIQIAKLEEEIAKLKKSIEENP